MKKSQALKETKHHMFWPESDYQTRAERRFRECEHLIQPGAKFIVHQLLHNKVEPPLKPIEEEMRECVDFLDRVPNNMRNRPFWRGELAMQYFVYAGANRPDREPECAQIRDNLARQLGYLAMEIPEGYRRNAKR